MRMIPAGEFISKLRELGLNPTEIRTVTGRLWKDGQGCYIAIPDQQEAYPDYVLDRILEHLGKLYTPPDMTN